MEKKPEQRFQSASDLAFALEALSESGSPAVVVVDRGSRSRWAWTAGVGAVVVLAGILITWWKIPPAVPVVESITQLTDDGELKQGTLVSDGSRIYFNEGQTGYWKIAQVSVSGGSTLLVYTRLVVPQVAPDCHPMVPHYSLWSAANNDLNLVSELRHPAYPLWSIPLPAGEPRRVGSTEVTDADFFPDGRIIFAKATDLYVADRDGSNQRKLVSVAGEVWNPNVSRDGRRIVSACLLVLVQPDRCLRAQRMVQASARSLRRGKMGGHVALGGLQMGSISFTEPGEGARQIFGPFLSKEGFSSLQENQFDLRRALFPTRVQSRAATVSRSLPSAQSGVANWFTMM